MLPFWLFQDGVLHLLFHELQSVDDNEGKFLSKCG